MCSMIQGTAFNYIAGGRIVAETRLSLSTVMSLIYGPSTRHFGITDFKSARSILDVLFMDRDHERCMRLHG